MSNGVKSLGAEGKEGLAFAFVPENKEKVCPNLRNLGKSFLSFKEIVQKVKS